MKLKTFLLVIAALSAKLSTAQTTQFRYRVLIEKKHKVLQAVPALQKDTVTLKKGNIVSSQSTYKKKDTTFTVDRADTVDSRRIELGDKTAPTSRSLRGWATVAFDKDDKSKLNINYWLDPSHKFLWGTPIEIIKKDGTSKTLVVKNDSTVLLTCVKATVYDKFVADTAAQAALIRQKAVALKSLNTAPSMQLKQQVDKLNLDIAKLQTYIDTYMWLDYAKELILEKDASGKRIAYYAQKYQDNYYLKLKNRDFVSFFYKTGEFGALTIPFKVRPKFKRNDKDISSEFTADINAGTYLGFTFGKVHYAYRNGEEIPPTKFQISVGPFLTVSRIEIDSTNTISAKEPLTAKKSIATLSPGMGLMFSVRELRFGTFIGKDYALGNTGRKWDYRGKTWFGFGFGYNLALIWGALK